MKIKLMILATFILILLTGIYQVYSQVEHHFYSNWVNGEETIVEGDCHVHNRGRIRLSPRTPPQ